MLQKAFAIMKFKGYCSMEWAECQNEKTIGQKAGNKRLKVENNWNGVLGLQVTKLGGQQELYNQKGN